MGNDTSSCRPQRNDLPQGSILAPILFHLYSNDCRLHMAENSFTLTTYVSPFKANTSANWNAVSHQIWRGCHTSVDSGDLPPIFFLFCYAHHISETNGARSSDLNKDFSPMTRTSTWVPRNRTRTSLSRTRI